MKKSRILIFFLCLILGLQCVSFGTSATSAGEDPTGEAQGPLTYGDITIDYGCSTVNGQYPLAGTDRMLDTAKSAFIYEINTGTVLYAYNPDLRVFPGALSKIMTALIAIEMGDLSDKITVSTREISELPHGAIVSDLKNGEVLTVEDVLHCLIIESANDAALVLAEYVAGNESEFVKLMNQRAVEMGCTDTYFANCHGLDNANQYTTARDMAKITLTACENETFKKIFGTVDYTIPPTNKMEEERDLESGNHFIYEMVLPQFNDNRVTGAMPSYVSAASGASVTFTAEAKNMSYVYVIMGSTRTYMDNGWQVDYYGNFEEALDLLEFSFGSYKINRILYSGQAFKTFQVGNGQNSVVGTPQEEINALVPVNAKMDNFIEKYTMAGGGLSAPIKKGDRIATLQLWYGVSCVAETDLYAMSDINSLNDTGLEISSAASRDDSDLSDFLGFLGVVCLVILIPMGGYLVYNSIMRSRVRAKRRRRRASRRRSR